MKKLLLSIVLSAFVLDTSAQTIIDTINFEKHRELVRIDTSQKNNIWEIGRPQKGFFDSAYSRPHAIVTDTVGFYPANNISSFTLILPAGRNQAGFWNNCFTPYIRFWQKFDTDTLQDSGIIDISSNMGKTWQPVYATNNKIFAVSGHSNGWQQGQVGNWIIILPKCDTALLRFTFHSKSVTTTKEGWMIDNVLLGYYMCEGIDEKTEYTQQLNLYPNPANTSITLSYQLNSNTAVLKLYNTMGQLLKSRTINNSNGTIIENVSDLPGSVYYYTLSVDGVVEATNKLVIIR